MKRLVFKVIKFWESYYQNKINISNLSNTFNILVLNFKVNNKDLKFIAHLAMTTKP